MRKAILKVSSDETTIGEYEYYGDTRRSKKVVQNRGPENVANDAGNTTVVFYYAGWGGPSLQGWGTRMGGTGVPPVRWSICETRTLDIAVAAPRPSSRSDAGLRPGRNVKGHGSNQTTFQYLWGPGGIGILPVSYVGELIWIEKNGDPTAGNDTNPDNTAAGEASEDPADMRYFVHQDRQPLTPRVPLSGTDREAMAELRSDRGVKGNWNVVALTLDTTAAVVRQQSRSDCRALLGPLSQGLTEYDTAGTNNGRVVERYTYTPYGSFVVLKGDSGCGELCSVSLSSPVGNPFGHQGLPFDHHKWSYQNRHREYPARLQRFAQRDPAGYLDGPDTYRYAKSNSAHLRDPSGHMMVRPLPGTCEADPDVDSLDKLQVCAPPHRYQCCWNEEEHVAEHTAPKAAGGKLCK